MQCWLDNEKLIVKQTKDYNFKFAVKFYTPDPELLEEEFSRYGTLVLLYSLLQMCTREKRGNLVNDIFFTPLSVS